MRHPGLWCPSVSGFILPNLVIILLFRQLSLHIRLQAPIHNLRQPAVQPSFGWPVFQKDGQFLLGRLGVDGLTYIYYHKPSRFRST